MSGLEFGDLDFVRRFVRGIDQKRFNLVLTADVLSCRVAEREALALHVFCKWVKWKCRPWKLVPYCPNIVLLYDGGNTGPLADLVKFAQRYAPKTHFAVFGPEGPIPNGIDFLVGEGATVHTEKRGYYHGDYHSASDHPAGVTRGAGTALRDSGARRAARGLPSPTAV